MTTGNILYYSKFCSKCKELIFKINNSNLDGLFEKIICVDNKFNTNVRTDLPDFITCVPVVITQDYEFPLIDDTIFQWIDYKQIEYNKKQQKKLENQQQIFPQNKTFPVIAGISTQSTSNENKNETMTNFEKLQEIRNNDNKLFANNHNGY